MTSKSVTLIPYYIFNFLLQWPLVWELLATHLGVTVLNWIWMILLPISGRTVCSVQWNVEIQVPRLPCKSACGQSKGNSLCTCGMKYSQFFLLRTSMQLTVFSGHERCPFYGDTCPEWRIHMLSTVWPHLTYCSFQKHVNSELQKPTDVSVFRCGQSSYVADLLRNRSLLQRLQKVMVYDLWLVDFDPFCVFLCFKVSLLVIVMLIDGSEKCICEGGLSNFRVRVFWKSALMVCSSVDLVNLTPRLFCCCLDNYRKRDT